ncbi:MAG: zinc ribbon domain-containing protein [Candidatus Omnitrophota bacterium]
MSPCNVDDFDFTTESELPERHSSQMKQCPACFNPIPDDSLFCLYCGEPVSPRKKKKWVILVVFLVLTAFLFWVFSLW